MGILRAGSVALALTVLAVPVPAQDPNSTDLVSVNISDHQILNDLARALRAEVSQIPVTVLLPIHVAAGACGLATDMLTRSDASDPANCDATSTSAAFSAAVGQQLLKE